MIDDPKKDDREKALEVLGMALNVLGWKVLEPPQEDHIVHGLVIGTPEYIDAWNELVNAKKENCQ